LKEFTRTHSGMPDHSRIKMEFRNVGFWGERKTEKPVEKPLRVE